MNKKFCPLTKDLCSADECGWWESESQSCSILIIANQLNNIESSRNSKIQMDNNVINESMVDTIVEKLTNNDKYCAAMDMLNEYEIKFLIRRIDDLEKLNKDDQSQLDRMNRSSNYNRRSYYGYVDTGDNVKRDELMQIIGNRNTEISRIKSIINSKEQKEQNQDENINTISSIFY